VVAAAWNLPALLSLVCVPASSERRDSVWRRPCDTDRRPLSQCRVEVIGPGQVVPVGLVMSGPGERLDWGSYQVDPSIGLIER
jgi:hypothetical protein